MSINGTSLVNERGHLCMTLGDENLPQFLEEYAVGVSFCETIKITTKTIGYLRESFRRICIGSIRPDESYEAPQSGKTRAELEEEIAGFAQRDGQLMSDLQLANVSLDNYRLELDSARGRNFRVHQLARKLDVKIRWPWITRTGVARQIDAILDDIS